MGEVRRFTRAPYRRIECRRSASGWQAFVIHGLGAGAVAPASPIHVHFLGAAMVGARLAKRTGLPLDFASLMSPDDARRWRDAA